MKRIIVLLAISMLYPCSTTRLHKQAKGNIYQDNRTPSQYIGIMDNNHKD